MNAETPAPWLDPEAKPYVQIDRVSKRFGADTVIDSISLNIYKSEFFSLLGPSGCGKTTLLRMLAGFETPDSGRILIDGEDVTFQPPHRRPVNMMFQSYALFPHMTVESNIAFGLRQDGVPKAERDRRVAEVIEMVRLAPFARRKPHLLSGGQRQRVALARSLVKKPKLLLLDEPLGALDRKLREHTCFELVNIQEKTGITFVIVTHDQEEAMTVSCRVAVMEQGRICQVAPPREIYESPASGYVAQFVGDITLFEGRVIANDDGGAVLACNAVNAAFRAYADRSVRPGVTARLAVRPEKIRIALEQPEDATLNQLHGEVWDIGYRGDLSMYRVRLPSGVMVMVTRANSERQIDASLTWGSQVWLSWRPKEGVLLLE